MQDPIRHDRRTILLKRVYEPPAGTDGLRILVDRLWPRGMRRDALQLAQWARDAAPSDELRRWLHDDPERWAEFVRRYHAELDGNPDAWQSIIASVRAQPVTLLYAARDPERNNAAALRQYLAARL